MADAATTAAPGVRERDRAEATTKKRDKGPATPWWMWVAVVAILVFCLFPFYWLINLSLKTGDDLSSNALYPPHPTLANYKSIFQNDDFVKSLRNSAIVSIVTTTLAIIVGAFCAYALARLRFKGKFWILALVLSITTFPGGAARAAA
jgi:multiple sugar transport system permease protein